MHEHSRRGFIFHFSLKNSGNFHLYVHTWTNSGKGKKPPMSSPYTQYSSLLVIIILIMCSWTLGTLLFIHPSVLRASQYLAHDKIHLALTETLPGYQYCHLLKRKSCFREGRKLLRLHSWCAMRGIMPPPETPPLAFQNIHLPIFLLFWPLPVSLNAGVPYSLSRRFHSSGLRRIPKCLCAACTWCLNSRPTTLTSFLVVCKKTLGHPSLFSLTTHPVRSANPSRAAFRNIQNLISKSWWYYLQKYPESNHFSLLPLPTPWAPLDSWVGL